MHSDVMGYLDIALLVFMMVMGLSASTPLFREWGEPINQVIEDKSAVAATNAIYATDEVKYGYDILNTMMLTDENAPYPRAIKINNTPVIVMNNTWIANKSANIQYVLNNSNYNLKNMLNWRVKSVKYVYSGSEPYWQYELVP